MQNDGFDVSTQLGDLTHLDVLLPFAISIPTDQLLSRRFRVHRLYRAGDQAGLLAEIGPRIRVVATSAGPGFPGHLWEALPALELVVIHGVGTDKIDLEEAARRHVRVLTSPHVMADDTADLAIGMWISLCRRLVEGDGFVREGQWQPGKAFPLARKVTGQRIGIVGLGRIGSAIARRAAAFASTIAYTSRNPVSDCPYIFVPVLRDLAARSDVLFLAIPGGASTNRLVNADILSALGPTGILVNVARGSVVDEAALLSALREKGWARRRWMSSTMNLASIRSSWLCPTFFCSPMLAARRLRQGKRWRAYWLIKSPSTSRRFEPQAHHASAP